MEIPDSLLEALSEAESIAVLTGAGIYIVEVNPNKTAISSYMDARLEAPSGIALPILLEALDKFIKVRNR
jgi:NAD-dependent SIR2 family protein deacetylase